MADLASLLRRKLALKSNTNESQSTKLHRQHGETATLKLPPEIIIIILSLLGRNSRDLQQVTAVCSRWRAIAIQTPDLWTKIDIEAKGRNMETTRALLNRISLFLSRTGSLLLDVEWHAYGNPKSVPLFYDLFRQKGPFNRWKTLHLDLNQEVSHTFERRREMDEFSRLENLVFMHTPPLVYLDHISKTVTAKLRSLELGPSFRCPTRFLMEYTRIFGYITKIKLWSRVILPPVLLLPNVTTLTAGTMPNLSIPHVRHLFVKKISLWLLSTLQLVNLVSLRIRIMIYGNPADYNITLPNLRWLGVKKDSLSVLLCLKVPSLHSLSIECLHGEPQTIDGPLAAAIRSGFEAPRLLILLLNIYLDGPATLEILGFFPDISRVELRYRDASCAQEILSHLFPHKREADLCSSLDVLHVRLDTPPTNEPEWRIFVQRLASHIGVPLWRLESRWPEGGYSRRLGTKTQQRTPCIYPWRVVESG